MQALERPQQQPLQFSSSCLNMAEADHILCYRGANQRTEQRHRWQRPGSVWAPLQVKDVSLSMLVTSYARSMS